MPFRRPDSGAPPARTALRISRLSGNLVEISGAGASGVLSTAMALVSEAQFRESQFRESRFREHQPGLAAWVATTRSLFFPPDAVRAGVLLERLVLLRLENPAAQIRAAARILQSGAFGLVVVDLAGSVQPDFSGQSFSPGRGRRAASREFPPLSRLAGLARRHESTLVLLTEKTAAAPSLDPRVTQRFDASRLGSRLVITTIKDKGSPGRLRGKRLPPGFRFERKCREPAGMC